MFLFESYIEEKANLKKKTENKKKKVQERFKKKPHSPQVMKYNNFQIYANYSKLFTGHK